MVVVVCRERFVFLPTAFWFIADKRHRGEVVSSPSRPAVRESTAAEASSVERLSISDDENWSAPSSLLCLDDDVDNASCARTCYVLPAERWSGKRKRHDDAVGLKHMKTSSKPTWVDGLGHNADESHSRASENQSNVGGRSSQSSHVASPVPISSPAKCGTPSSLTSSSPLKPADKRVPATKAQPPTPSQPPPVSRSSKKHSESGVKTGPWDVDTGGTRTRPSVTSIGSKTGLLSAESTTKTRPSVTEGGTKARLSDSVTKYASSSSLAVSPTSAAVSSIVGMSPPATPVMPEPQVTLSRKQSRQKGRTQRDPNSLPCKGNRTRFTFNVCCITMILTCHDLILLEGHLSLHLF